MPMIDKRLRFETYAEAHKVASRKSTWLVLYLRARKSRDRLKGYFRAMHLKEPS